MLLLSAEILNLSVVGLHYKQKSAEIWCQAYISVGMCSPCMTFITHLAPLQEQNIYLDPKVKSKPFVFLIPFNTSLADLKYCKAFTERTFVTIASGQILKRF